jgi:ribonuclease HI
MSVGGFGHKILSPAGVFTAELSALFTALRHIAEVIQPRERCLILTDSLSSIKAMLSRKIQTLNNFPRQHNLDQTQAISKK